MKIIDNLHKFLKDDLSIIMKPNNKVAITASCFSTYAYQELKAQLERIDELRFIIISHFLRQEKQKILYTCI